MSKRKPTVPSSGNVAPDFTVHQLTVFRSVAQHLSYTRAAQTLYLSQPAVAQQVKTLEQVLGLRLFERRGNDWFRLKELGESRVDGDEGALGLARLEAERAASPNGRVRTGSI